jgi:putative exporter of polyketide antibiotics
MAELYVERKRKSPVLWILLALILLAVVGYLVWANRDKLSNDNTNTQQTTTQQTTTTTTP